jgi:hypothetical protein
MYIVQFFGIVIDRSPDIYGSTGLVNLTLRGRQMVGQVLVTHECHRVILIGLKNYLILELPLLLGIIGHNFMR